MARGTILVSGGTGKVSIRLIPLLSSAGCTILSASRSGTLPPISHVNRVKFDWFEPSTHTLVLPEHSIKAIFLIAPPVVECLPIMKPFIALAAQRGAERFVLLSASILLVGDGPMMASVSKWIASLGVEYVILRPSWFMENFSEVQHQTTIRDQDYIISAAGNGKIPFIAADEIAAVAFGALIDQLLHNTDHLILGPDHLSYDNVCSNPPNPYPKKKTTHIRISEDDLANAMEGFGILKDYARILANLDTKIKNREEERMDDVVLRVHGEATEGIGGVFSGCSGDGCLEED